MKFTSSQGLDSDFVTDDWLTIGAVAERTGVATSALRYYDREGLLAPSQYSEAGYRLYTDADLPFDFNFIPQLVALASDDRVIVGYRTNRGEGLRRWILTKGYNLFCRFGLGLRLRDINFACKLIPRRAVRGMKLSSEGSFIDAELLLE